MPVQAVQDPIAAGRSARSNAELISANEPGTKNAPPNPWTRRPAINTAGVPAVAASTEPAPKATSPKRITGIRPNRSEMAPPGSTVAATASR